VAAADCPPRAGGPPPTLHDWLPGGALGVIARGAGDGAHTPLWAAAGCAVAYAGALVAAGTRRLIDRDVT
jgi:hypothetical protein